MIHTTILIRSGTIAGLILLPVLSVYGQADSLSIWLKTALKNNPVITAAKRNVDARQQEIRIAPSLPDPSVSGGYFITPVETRVGPQHAKIGISQMIPWPGKLFTRKAIAQKEYEASLEAQKSAEARILGDVRAVYAEYYALGKEITISQDNLKLLQEMENVLVARYATATASQVSLLKVQVEMASLDDQISSLLADKVKIREKAIALLNLPESTSLPVPTQLPQLPVPADVDSLLEDIDLANPALAQARSERDALSLQVDLAQQSFAPDLMLSTDYVFTGKSSSSMTAASESGKDPWVAGMSITLPIWTGNKFARISKASAMKEMQNATITGIRNQTVATALSLTEEYHDAQRKIILYTQTLIPQSQQTTSLVGESYINGKSTILDFLDARRMQLTLQVMLEKQKARREMTAGKIDMLLGGVLTRKSMGEYE